MTNTTGLSILTAADLLAADLAPRRDLLPPLLRSGTAALVYGPTGIGKSFFALGIAWAIASGGCFLGWQAPRPRRVLYVDGELGAAELRERLALFGPPPERLALLPCDRNTGPLLDLAEGHGIVRLVTAWGNPDLLVLDPLSTLAGLGSGDPERWHRLQRFVLHLKQSGRAVLMVHHANREGALHGTTRRANAVDLMLALRRPESERAAGLPSGNARFEIHVEKRRSLQGAPLAPLLAELATEDGRGHWRWGPAEAGRLARAAALLNRGLSARQTWEALGISRSLLFKLKAQARAQGLLNRTGGES